LSEANDFIMSGRVRGRKPSK